MKQKLLLFILPVILFTATLQAQDKVWNFANPSANWPLGFAGVSTPTIIDNLGLVPGDAITNMGQIDGNNQTWTDGFSGSQRIKQNGAGVNSGVVPEVDMVYVPTKRYMYFAVTGPCDVKIWFRSGGSSTRSLYVTDGSGVVGKFTETETTSPQRIETFSYTTNAPANLYIFGVDNAFNLYKMELTGAVGSTTLSLNSKVSPVTTNVHASGNRIYVSNVKTSSEVNIYSITGALVKSLKTNNDIDFVFKSGLYIATIKTNEGQKSVKLVTN
uniref:T9SS type A sorting domain-containing protein n=1 Tax=Mariniflexile sp. TaxID=1979402 RepID=UPI004048098A